MVRPSRSGSRRSVTLPRSPCRDREGHSTGSNPRILSREHLVHRRGDSVELLVGQRQAARQIKPPPRDALGVRMRLSLEHSHPAVYGLLMHRPEERTRADLSLAKASHRLIGVERKIIADHDTVDPVDVSRVFGGRNGKLKGAHVGQERGVSIEDVALTGDKLVEPLELSESESGLQVGHPEVPAELFVYEPAPRLHVEIAKISALLGELVIVGDDHPAFTGRDVLVRVKAESGDVAERSARPVSISLSDHFGGVFDDAKVVFRGECQDRIHINWKSIDVDCHDRFRAFGDAGLDGRYVHVPGARVAVYQDRNRAEPGYRRSARDDREGRHDDLVAGPEAQSGARGVERGGSVTDGDSVLAAHSGREFFFELAYERAFGGDPAGIYALVEILAFVAVEDWLVDGDHPRHRGRPEGRMRRCDITL